MKIRRIAFTLAEVLITFVIIGLVAAMPMQSLFPSYHKQHTLNESKKVYSELNQAVRISENEFGTLETWDLSGYTDVYEQNKYFTDNYLLPNIKVVKTCDMSNDHECFADTVYTIDGNEAGTDTGVFKDPTGKRFYFIAASGYSVLYWVHGAGNGAWFWVDLNGPKKRPNTLGKDIFAFIRSWGNSTEVSPIDGQCLSKLGFYPYGLNCQGVITRDDIKSGNITGIMNNFNCTKGTGGRYAGALCASLIMFDSWKMSKDYPW